jgi:hypothetical protein
MNDIMKHYMNDGQDRREKHDGKSVNNFLEVEIIECPWEET